MKRSIFIGFAATLILTFASFGQDIDPTARAARWREFNKHAFDKFNFSTQRLTKAKISPTILHCCAEWSLASTGAFLRNARSRII
jgi:hypothetical protein